MIVKFPINKQKTKFREGLLCLAALSDVVNDDGLIWCEFYPVQPLLGLRQSDKILVGHPLLDLKPDDDYNGPPTAFVERLQPKRVVQLKKRLIDQNKYLAVVANAKYMAGKGGKSVDFYFVDGTDYLSDDDRFWLQSLVASGEDYYEKLKAVRPICLFIKWLIDTGLEAGRKKCKKKRVKRKYRRLEEVQNDLQFEV